MKTSRRFVVADAGKVAGTTLRTDLSHFTINLTPRAPRSQTEVYELLRD